MEETTGLLAARAPKLRKAVRNAKKAGYARVVLDGTFISIERVAADRPRRTTRQGHPGIADQRSKRRMKKFNEDAGFNQRTLAFLQRHSG